MLNYLSILKRQRLHYWSLEWIHYFVPYFTWHAITYTRNVVRPGIISFIINARQYPVYGKTTAKLDNTGVIGNTALSPANNGPYIFTVNQVNTNERVERIFMAPIWLAVKASVATRLKEWRCVKHGSHKTNVANQQHTNNRHFLVD